MENQAINTVNQMYQAFAKADMEALLQTVSDDSVWAYYGTHKIPRVTFKGKDGVAKFFHGILVHTEVKLFEPSLFVTEGNTVVVRGREHQVIKKTGEELKQEWVQIYTVENGLITKMEEFAATETENIK